MKALALLLFFVSTSCATAHARALAQAGIDYPECKADEAGTWSDGEVLVRLYCPGKAPFVVAYGVYPAAVKRIR